MGLEPRTRTAKMPSRLEILASSLEHGHHKLITEADGVKLLSIQITDNNLKLIISLLRLVSKYESRND